MSTTLSMEKSSLKIIKQAFHLLSYFFYQFMKINEIALNALHLELYIFQVNYFVTFSFQVNHQLEAT